jgi:hypothetical protein
MTLTAAEIETMDRAALLAAWSEVFQSPVPKGLSQSFLRRFLAFEVQARQFGGLPKNFLADLEKRIDGKGGKMDATPKPGGRLLREWNGTTHTVEVTDAGYRWNGQTHRSLSSVARAITGARWSGPRFFGLKEEAQ